MKTWKGGLFVMRYRQFDYRTVGEFRTLVSTVISFGFALLLIGSALIGAIRGNAIAWQLLPFGLFFGFIAYRITKNFVFTGLIASEGFEIANCLYDVHYIPTDQFVRVDPWLGRYYRLIFKDGTKAWLTPDLRSSIQDVFSSSDDRTYAQKLTAQIFEHIRTRNESAGLV